MAGEHSKGCRKRFGVGALVLAAVIAVAVAVAR